MGRPRNKELTEGLSVDDLPGKGLDKGQPPMLKTEEGDGNLLQGDSSLKPSCSCPGNTRVL